MGREKDRLIEEEERGWSSVGRGFICDNCVREEFLTQYIRESGTERPCDYCDLTQDEADIRCVPFDELMDLIAEGICAYYNSADDEGIPYESAEGGYAFPEHIFSTYELVTQQIGLEVVTERAMRDIVRALPDQAWCRRGFWGLSLAQALSAGWEDFVEKVKHKTRYLFFEPEPHEVSVASDVLAAPSESPEEEIAAPVLPIASGDAGFGIVHDAQEGIPASRVLDAIGDVVRGLGLVRLLAAGTVLFRARVHNNTELPTSAAELGPPTCEQAIKPNRMSPAGIVMFYGAFDSETAVAERFQLDCERAEEKVVSVGAWELVKDCLILDLTGLPPVPSIFDRTRRDLRGGIGFIHGFVEDLKQTVARDGREHIEYVPTQIVTEYFRFRFMTYDNRKVLGILYESSLRKNGKACVPFVDQGGCGVAVETWRQVEQYLQLKQDRVERFDGKTLAEHMRPERR